MARHQHRFGIQVDKNDESILKVVMDDDTQDIEFSTEADARKALALLKHTVDIITADDVTIHEVVSGHDSDDEDEDII